MKNSSTPTLLQWWRYMHAMEKGINMNTWTIRRRLKRNDHHKVFTITFLFLLIVFPEIIDVLNLRTIPTKQKSSIQKERPNDKVKHAHCLTWTPSCQVIFYNCLVINPKLINDLFNYNPNSKQNVNATNRINWNCLTCSSSSCWKPTQDAGNWSWKQKYLDFLGELVRLTPPHNHKTYYSLIIDVKDIASQSSFQQKFHRLNIHHHQNWQNA